MLTFVRMLWASGAVAFLASGAAAQPLTDHSTNLGSARVETSGDLDFTFTHRMSLAGSKIVNSPTFVLEAAPVPGASIALRYATNSDIHGQFNEVEPSVKLQVLGGAPRGLSALGAYNTAARSLDAAFLGSWALGPFTLMGSGRGFTSGFGVGGATGALGAGLLWHLTRVLSVSADYNGVVGSQDLTAIAARTPGGLMPAWSAGLQFVIPFSPHAMALYATNANTRTLQGSSRGTSGWRVGFDFRVPFSNMGRWGAFFNPPSVAPAAATRSEAVEIGIQNFRFAPDALTVRRGTVIRWANRDSVAHSSTSDASRWDSGLLQPGQSFSRRFDEPGEFPYHCTPHPYMKGRIRVE